MLTAYLINISHLRYLQLNYRKNHMVRDLFIVTALVYRKSNMNIRFIILLAWPMISKQRLLKLFISVLWTATWIVSQMPRKFLARNHLSILGRDVKFGSQNLLKLVLKSPSPAQKTKNVQKLVFKKPRFVPFGANLTKFGVKPTFPGEDNT